MSKLPVASLNTPEYDKLIELLRAVRKEKGVSQEELSKRLGQSQNFVLKIEQKERRFDVVEFFQLFTALELDPVEVFARFAKDISKK